MYKYQFGFRTDHSPNLALIYLVDRISNALENGEYVIGLFLDFSKAFDTVNHQILLKKLEFHGVRGTALAWFHSYLSCREQYVQLDETKSSRKQIVCGVPQGSVLGPLLFLLYINDLSYVSSKLFSVLFADDSNMFLSGNNPNELIQLMNTEMVKVIDWLKVNKLSLNLKKTHYIIFRRRRGKILLDNDLVVGGVKINMTEWTKFLGVVIDQYLTFTNHISYIKGKISRCLGILYKGRKYLNKCTLLTLYNAFIYPYLNYCIVVWGNAFQTHLEPLVKLQKRAIRLISCANRIAHTEPIFKTLHVLKLSKLYVYSVQLFMYKYHHSSLPGMFDNFYTMNNDIHYHNTRQQNALHVPTAHSTLGSKVVRYTGVKIYNYFTKIIDYNCTIITYKKKLKLYMINNEIEL